MSRPGAAHAAASQSFRGNLNADLRGRLSTSLATGREETGPRGLTERRQSVPQSPTLPGAYGRTLGHAGLFLGLLSCIYARMPEADLTLADGAQLQVVQALPRHFSLDQPSFVKQFAGGALT